MAWDNSGNINDCGEEGRDGLSAGPLSKAEETHEVSQKMAQFSAIPRNAFHRPRTSYFSSILLLLLATLIPLASAARLDFQNCLSSGTINSTPRRLQFTPLHVLTSFDLASSTNKLNVTIYGNVSGQTTTQTLPPPTSQQWSNPNFTLGKIVDLSDVNNKYTTLFSRFNVLSYTPWAAAPARFCLASIHGQCPISPAFFVDDLDLAHLPAFAVAHDMFSTYAFTSITATITVESGDLDGSNIACITTTITPDLGPSLNAVFRYLPLVILISVGVATVFAAILSPWGSADIFRWSSNYGRDEDLLRLVTPGFGDCLQYIQFIVLTGSLSLNYPGFYQPTVSRVGWSSLMFNQSFVSGGSGTPAVIDGVYEYRPNTVYGLDRTSQLIGMESPRDIWAGMIVWLVVITGGVVLLTQVGFAIRSLWRTTRNVPAEDLRSKNGPFTTGNVVRCTFNYFIFPLISLSMFQFVIAGQGPSYSVALAAIVIVVLISFCIALMMHFRRTRPKAVLFDDLLTLLTYGPLYNTFCDDAYNFALIPIFLNFVRGIAIGAVQSSGIAQVVLLAICEIIFILTLNSFRPFPTASSMNLYHSCFAFIRFITILLSIAFVPSLGVADSSRGWIGYAILLVHACVLIFGFFLNAIQTLIEVFARLAGAGGRNDVGQGPARGGLTQVLGMRQLSRRMPHRDQPTRHSRASDAAMLNSIDPEQKSLQLENSRSRTISPASAMMMQQQGSSDHRRSQGFDGAGGHVSPGGESGRTRPRASTRLSNLSSTMFQGGIVGIRQVESKDPFYRPPRRNTMEALAPRDANSRLSMAKSGDEQAIEDDAGEGASTVPPLRDEMLESNHDLTREPTDYASREVDFYYRMRGPALSSGTRKLRTGPADPTRPVSSATGWFKGLLGGKTKEKNKGFEVVRSARAPPPGMFASTPDGARARTPVPYSDEADTPERPRKDIDTMADEQQDRHLANDDAEESDDNHSDIPRAPATPPLLPQIDSVGGIEMPSRFGSQVSRFSRNSRKKRKAQQAGEAPPVPAIPRKSSRRTSSQDANNAMSDLRAAGVQRARLSTVAASPIASPQRGANNTASSSRIPFQTTSSTSNPIRNPNPTDPADQNLHPVMTSTSMYARSGSDSHVRDERPSNVGYVSQHRASDGMRDAEEVGRSAEAYGRFEDVDVDEPGRRR